MHSDSNQRRKFLAGNITGTIVLILLIRLCISCSGGRKELNDQVTCDVLYLKSEIPGDSLSPGYISSNFSRLEWGVLKETGYSNLNRRKEIWYRVFLPYPVSQKSILVMPAYSHGFDLYSGDSLVYKSDNDGQLLYSRVHVIPVANPDKPVFIRFRYSNFNNAIIRYPVYLVPENNITEDLALNKFHPFNNILVLIFPGTALCVLGMVSLMLFLRRRYKEYNTFLYFGLFSLMTGILYVLPVARLGGINLSPDWYYAIEHFLVHVLLIFFVLLNMSIFNSGNPTIFKVLIALLGILALLDFPVFLLNPLPFHFNMIQVILVGVFAVTSSITGLRETKKSEVVKRFMFYMLMLTYILAIGDVILSLLFPENDLVLFGIGIIVYVLSVIYYLEDQYYFNLGRSQQFFTELEFRKNEILRLEQQNLKSQFSALKSQINPHFLFNSLNVLTSIIRKDSDLSEKFVEQLSKTYRYILEFKSEELVPLQTELEFIKAYHFLMKLRFGEKLDIEISEELYRINARIPHLSLQMLIENSVKHNTFSTVSPLKIRISMAESNVIVVNNFQPRTTREVSTGIGHINIEERYRLVSDKIPWFGIVGDEFIAKIPLIE